MMKNFHILILVCAIFLCCKSNSQETLEETESVSDQQTITTDSYASDQETDEGYEDGEYCATIEYYNSSTGNSSTYTLGVEVENGELVQINWSNGGWLDSSHFDPPEVDSDGSCSFTTFDGKDYDIQIEGSGACSYSSSSPADDEEDEEESEESTEVEEEVSEESTSQYLVQPDQLFTWINKVFWRMKNIESLANSISKITSTGK